MRIALILAALLLTTTAHADVLAISESSYPGVIGLTDAPCPKGTGMVAIFDSRISNASATGCWVEVGEKVIISWNNLKTAKTVYEYPSTAFIVK